MTFSHFFYVLHVTFYILHITLHTLHFTLCPFTVYISHFTLYFLHFTLYISHLHFLHFYTLPLTLALDTGHLTLDTGHWTLGTWHLALDTWHLALGTWHLTLGWWRGTSDWENHWPFCEGHSRSHTGNQLLLPSASLPRGAATEVQNVRGQRHGRVVLCLVRELALDSGSSHPRNPHGMCIQLQLSRLLGGVEQNDRSDEIGELHPAPGAIHGPTQRAFQRRCCRCSHTKGNKRSRLVEIRSHRATIRTTSAAPQILTPSAGILLSLRLEVRKRTPKSIFWVHSDCEPFVQPRSMSLLLPRRPRGAYFVVLSNGACKVGCRNRQRGFLVGWYELTVEATDLRGVRSDARSGRVLGAVISPSSAS